MNALDCVRNTVFVEWIEETSEPTYADTPATAVTAALVGKSGPGFNPTGVHRAWAPEAENSISTSAPAHRAVLFAVTLQTKLFGLMPARYATRIPLIIA